MTMTQAFILKANVIIPLARGGKKKALLSRGNALIYFVIAGIATLLFCDKAFIYSTVM